MSAIEPLCRLIGIQPNNLTKEENLLVEIELFARICEELKEAFKKQYKEYFRLMKLSTEKENTMLESKFVRLIIQDILSTGEYSIEGIAHYTNTHEDIIQETYIGKNTNPSAALLRKIIELHRTVRRDLYQTIMKKIAVEYLAAA